MSAASTCLHIHLGLGTRFRLGLGAIRPFRGFTVISDIYVMAIYHFYKGGKKTFNIYCFTQSTVYALATLWMQSTVKL